MNAVEISDREISAAVQLRLFESSQQSHGGIILSRPRKVTSNFRSASNIGPTVLDRCRFPIRVDRESARGRNRPDEAAWPPVLRYRHTASDIQRISPGGPPPQAVSRPPA